jgi:glycosyltransferase involved in cell wall biosynthesis
MTTKPSPPLRCGAYDVATTMISIVIPVFNEREYIEEVLLRVQAVPLKKEIVVIDDCSTDGTRPLLQALQKAQGSVQDLSHIS